MNISTNNITFGKKVPIAKCKILNKETNKYVNATMYEYTCNSYADVIKIRKLRPQFSHYGDDFYYTATKMKSKIKHNIGHIFPTSLYSLQIPLGETIGLCATRDFNNGIGIEFIENAKKDKYKYVGSNMLGVLGAKVLSSNQDFLEIHNAEKSAEDFYTKHCGFEEKKSKMYVLTDNLVMEKDQISKFLSTLKERITKFYN